jgi:methylated-DNA-[protein]-cysteine S-methyltransferase
MLMFETALGRCGLRWSEVGIVRVLLPHPDPAALPVVAAPADVPAFVTAAVDGITSLFAGGAAELRWVPVDERGVDEFRRAVYAATREIPAGATRSYGEIARTIGRPDAARDVGAALARNPTPVIVPCHRVVAANGALTGFSAPGGLATKRRMLELEGAPGYGQQLLFG